MKLSGFLLPAAILGTIFLIYFFYFAPSNELGLFSNFDPGSEINQAVNVKVVKNKNFRRNASGAVMAFYAKDKHGVEKMITLHEPAPAGFENAEVIELFGHFHGNSFTVSKLKILE